MSDIAHNSPGDALRLLAELAVERSKELNQYDKDPAEIDNDEETDSDCPILGSFVTDGEEIAVLQMTNFTLAEYRGLYDRLRPFVVQNYNVGRGKRSKYIAKDVLFMALTVYKTGTMWDFAAKTFNMKSTSFERLVTNFIRMVTPFSYATYVKRAAEKFKMELVLSDHSQFRVYGMARYATDVTFHQSNRPRGNHEEAKGYFSGKHKIYGYKTEVSVLPNGIVLGLSRHFIGSVANVDIFYDNIGWHRDELRKSSEERNVTDFGPLIERFSKYWAVLMDKGYQGAARDVQAIIPVKKPKAEI